MKTHYAIEESAITNTIVRIRITLEQFADLTDVAEGYSEIGHIGSGVWDVWGTDPEVGEWRVQATIVNE